MKKFKTIGLILAAIAVVGCAKSTNLSNASEGIFHTNVGKIDVFMLVESTRDGNTAILVDADEEILNRFIPEDGFEHTANAFLVKTPTQNIMIDTGTGVNGILIEKIKKVGVEPEDINAVFITHLHGDHFGSLQRDGEAVFPNAVIYLSARELEHFTVTNPNQGAINALAPYESQIVTFEPAELSAAVKPEIVPGIIPLAAFGHTPGHTVYKIENGKDKLLIIGDLLHVALVQFAVPEISATFDIDAAEAALTRRQVLSYAAENEIPVGGMHIVYPGIGDVTIEDSGFKFTPKK